MNDTPRAFIALGTNLPFLDVKGPDLLAQAVSALQSSGLKVRALSGVWETPAWPPEYDQPNYFNAVAELDREGLEPQPLYAILRAIEASFGRRRRYRYGARTMDLDILALDGFEGTFAGTGGDPSAPFVDLGIGPDPVPMGDVILPHPNMHERRFVLAPLAEIAPDWVHPGRGQTVAELLAVLPAGEGYRRVCDLAG